MTARSLHEIASGAAGKRERPRTGNPVRRNSKNAGGAEVELWRTHNMFPRSENNARMRAAEEFEHETKLPGKRNGAIGAIGLKVYRYLLRLRGKKSGRLDPTIRWLAEQVRHARSAVAEALKRLKEHGFIDWIRRCQPIENAEPDEQQSEQIANAYVLGQPAASADLVRRILRRPSEFVRGVAAKLARQRKVDSSTPAELIAEVQNPELRATLDRLNASMEGANPPGGHPEAL